MNIKKIKADFPIFGKKGAPKEFIYLDNAATTHKPNQVIDSIVDFYKNRNGNVYRGVHDLSENATRMYEIARQKVANFISASSSNEIIFTRGATEGINFIASAWARNNLKAGDEILLTQAEHHANFLPWQALAKELGLVLKFIPVDNSFTFGCTNPQHTEIIDSENFHDCNRKDCNYLENLLTSKTKLVALTLESNVLGPVWKDSSQLKKVIDRAHRLGAKVLIDAAQTIPHKKIKISELKPDFLVFSGHKMLGPTGIGVLYINKKLHDEVTPYQFGGSMVYSAKIENSTWQNAPQKFEAGTPAIASAIGLGVAIEYLENINLEEAKKHTAQLCSKLIDELELLDGVTIFGNIERIKSSGHLVSIGFDKVHPHDVASYLDKHGISVRAGNHCAQPLADALQIDSTLRISFYIYNTVDDVDTLVTILKQCLEDLTS